MTHFGNRVCGACDVDYAPTPDGRQIHRMIFGHTPSEPRPVPPAPMLISPRCRADRHQASSDGCVGGFLHNGRAVGCGCPCHNGPKWRDELEAA